MKSNSEFIINQLRELDRIFDLKGGALPIPKVEEIAYELKRYRENDPVDVLTTGSVFKEMQRVLVLMFEKKYGVNLVQFKSLKSSVVGPYNEFSFPAVRIAVFSIGDNDPPALWMLDWSDITPTFDIMTPERHALILNFKGFSE